MRAFRMLVPLLVALAAGVAMAAETGVFPARTFDIRQMSLGDKFADPPFRALAQSKDGLIYAGDNSGLIEFDGREWRRVALSPSLPVTMLGVSRSGDLVVGGSEYLLVLPDPQRPHETIDAALALPNGFQGVGEFWEFAEDNDRWCARSMALVVCREAGQFKFHRAKNGFGRMFQGKNRILVQVDGPGLNRIGPDGPEAIPGGELLRYAPIMSLTQDDDGEFLAVTRMRDAPLATWRWRDGTPPTQFFADTGNLRPEIGIGVIAYPGRVALPEDNGGVAIVDDQGRVLDRIEPSDLGVGSGAQAVMVDREGALWVAWPSAISRVEYPSRLNLFPFPSSFYGGVSTMLRGNNEVSVYNGNEILALRRDDDGRWRFRDRSRPGMTEILTMETLPDGEYIGTTQGFWPPGAKASVFPMDLIFSITPVVGSETDLWLGFRRGFGKVRLQNGVWEFVARRDNLPFDTITMTQFEAGELWIGSQVGRVMRVRIDPETPLEQWPIEEIKAVPDSRETLPQIENAGGRPLFWVGGAGVQDLVDGTLVPSKSIPLDETGPLREIEYIDDNQILFSSDRRHLALLKRDVGGVFRFTPSVFDQVAGIGRIRTVVADDDGMIWLVTESGVVRIDPTAEALAPKPQRVRIRDVQVDGRPDHGAALIRTALELSEGSSARFVYSLPSYRAPELNQFRSRIRPVGGTSEWSRWSNDTWRDFTNLPAGELLFEVEALDATGTPGGMAEMPLTVVAPWFRRPWAIALFWTFGLLLLALGVQWRVRALRARSAELERLVAIKTEALQIAATTDPLTGLWNRHRFGQWVRDEIPKVNARVTEAKADDRVDLIACVIDLDHFKRVNDQHGHAAGDAVLKAVAERLQGMLENGDLVFRFGGEEFVYLGINRHRSEGKKLAERIVQEIAKINVELESGVLLDPTASVGWSVYPFYRERIELFSLDFVLGLADRALYLAKQVGRNRAYGYLPNIDVDAIDRTQSDWRAQVFNRHTDFLKRI